MTRYDFPLEDALKRFLLEDKDGSPPSSSWLEGPSLREYEEHVRRTKPFTAEQLAWVNSHPACRNTLSMFERNLGVATQPESPLTLATGLPETVLSKVSWDTVTGRGEIWLDFGGTALAGALVFLQRMGKGLAGVLRVDEWGRVAFGSLQPGEYRVVPPLMSGHLTSFALSGALAPHGEPVRNDPRSLDQERDLEQGLHASVKLLPGAEVEFSFTTDNAELEGATVHIAFARPETGEVQLSGSVELEKYPVPPDHWAASWRYPLRFSGSWEVVFAVEKQRQP